MAEFSRTDTDDPGRQVWEEGWEDHQQRQLARLARLSLAEKLAWLEEAHRLVRRLHSNDVESPSPDGGR